MESKIKEMESKIKKIQPENEIEASILQDILVAIEDPVTSDFILTITDDLSDSPEDYDYTRDDFEVFIYKYELTSTTDSEN